ncbi:hypothetical protein FRC10_007456 [Ceratobasidium sp. 414]|nr:hypothetical protein FRC10_007456 [Ceratobasidium sp. 414]
MSLSRQIRDAQSVIDVILARGSVPITIFQTAISLAQNPDILVAFAHSDLIGSCMHIVHTHASTQPNTAYELACLQVLAIGLLVLLLGGNVEGFLNWAVEKRAGRNGLALLSGYVCFMQIEGMEYTENMAQRTEGVPGISDEGAEWLIEYLYSQRKTLLTARIENTTALQGFTSLLSILWYRATRAINLISHGHESNEDVLLFAVIDRLERFPGPEYEADRCAPIDYADLRNIMDAYVKRVAPMPQYQPPPLNWCNELLRWATLGLEKSVEPTWHMLVPVVEASIPRLWLGLEDLSEVGPLHRVVKASSVTETFIHVRAFMQDRRVKNEDKVRLVQIIIDGDWVNLLGRVLLFGALDGPSAENKDMLGAFDVNELPRISHSPIVVQKKTMHMIRDKKQVVFMTAEEIPTRWTPSPKAFDRMAYDWLKVYEHKNVLQGIHLSRNDVYWQYLFQSEVEWFRLGEILGFTRRLDRDRGSCTYPRCAGAHGEILPKVCAGCGRIRYGSSVCQTA